jgi:hypothetical protein
MRSGFRCRIDQHNYCSQRKTETSIDLEIATECWRPRVGQCRN